MEVAGQKTQLLVLSQSHRDAVGCRIRVAGQTVEGGPELKLLGVTLDRTLGFGPHCRNLRRRVRPRISQLRRITGRSWGLEERQLRAVANGYVRGAIEHAAAAWMPAAARTNIEVLEREMRAAARVITGCIGSAPIHGVMAEAGVAPVAARRTALAARMLAKAMALPEEDPLHRLAVADPPRRLKTVCGWRQLGREVWRTLGVEPPVEPLLPVRPPPWLPTGTISFNLDIGAGLPAGTAASTKKEAALHHLASLTQCATWVWTDGSATGGVLCGGAGALVVHADDDRNELKRPAGALCSSFRAEMLAIAMTLERLATHPRNEAADVLAGEAAALEQEIASIDVNTIYKTAARLARDRAARDRPSYPDPTRRAATGWYRELMGKRYPPPVSNLNRRAAIDVHQIRTGHWSGSTQFLHSIGRSPSAACARCRDLLCEAARCPLCGEEAETPRHILLTCPGLMGVRLKIPAVGNILPTPDEVWRSDVVAALVAAFKALQS
ncbi:Retrovirus-related Pol polyprotein from type-1 retrotransposable element R1 4 [Amphibalanus amphitrite]|uniref:Retrovirus-related Pol polyprotein from type-1 retrotransposable element R1 4 n=1 Tax=Amphibalanus amphitrite TaxID=1232801 RepID=A0A6A4VUG3_AMPAM|nr:Retrovirus-related Pol polyprotein from type-1 retrotransposable element R1 4 [Amphibalanus amphitrite]